jgi:trigger factor
MMGNEIMGRFLDKEINDAMFGYIEENEIDIIFSPMPADKQEQVDVDARNVQDINLKYDLALRPDVEVKMPAKKFERLQLLTDDAFIDERLLALRRQSAESTEIDKGIQENDILTVQFTELEGGKPKEGGITNEAKLFLDSLTEDLLNTLKGQDVGFTTEVNIHDIEKDSAETYVRKYLLEIEEEDEFTEIFTLEVKGISRRDPAELNEEFFKKFDATGAITDEAGLREKIAADNSDGFNRQGNSMVDFEVQKALVEETELELPLDFLKKIHDDEADQTYERFERGIRWMLIRNAYLKQEGIEITAEDLQEATTTQLIQMMGGQRPEWLNDEVLDTYAAQVMEDEKQRRALLSQVTEAKIMASLREKIETEDNFINSDEFNKRIEDFNKEYQASEGEE